MIDKLQLVGKTNAPIRPGANASNRNRKFPRFVWSSGTKPQPRSNVLCVAGLLFMKSPFHERKAVTLVKDGTLVINDMGEIWRMRSRFGGGPLRSITPRRADRLSRGGYMGIDVRIGRKSLSFAAHRLVWQYWNGDIPEDKQINHKNGIKSDNRLENLEVVTCRENILHAFRVLGTRSCKGTHHSGHKLTDADIVKIRQLRSEGMFLRNIASLYNVCVPSISLICSRKQWNHVV